MDLPIEEIFLRLGISALLGLLVGLQRERVSAGLAGLRTFALITILGTLAALLSQMVDGGGWIVAAAFLGVVAVIVIENMRRPREAEGDRGTTTEIAILVMFTIGAYLALGSLLVGVALGGGVAVLLQFKPELHGFAARLGDEDVRATMQFVLITCVVLPVLPDQKYGPLETLVVLNPREIWLMVVLIVGISLGGYIIYKFFGREAGIALGGILGGAISSTATTVSYSRRSATHADAARLAAVVIVIASAVVYVRVLVEISAVAPGFLRAAAGPTLVMMFLTILPATFVWIRVWREEDVMPEQENPTQLRSAVVFGVMYAGVLLALAAAKEYLDGRGLYLVAGISGMTDMDAITLSTSRLVRDNHFDMALGWRLIVVAAMANLVFKAGIVAVLGNRRLLRYIIPLYTLPLLGGALILAFWPDGW